MTYSATKFEVATHKPFRGRYIYKKIQYLTFDLDLGVKVTRNFAQYPLHHVTYSTKKFEVATSNGLGGDTFTFTRNVTEGRTHGRTDGRWTDFDTKLIYPFSKEKIGYNKGNFNISPIIWDH